jgi:hypothetical protein
MTPRLGRRWPLAILAIALPLAACTAGDTLLVGPFEVGERQLTGPYTFTVTGATDCRTLPVSNFSFAVRAIPDKPTDGIRLELESTEQNFEIVFCKTCSLDPTHIFGSIDTRQRIAIGGGFFLTLRGVLNGLVETGPPGRGRVATGVHQGVIGLSRAADLDTSAVGQCGLNLPNSWTLEPR